MNPKGWTAAPHRDLQPLPRRERYPCLRPPPHRRLPVHSRRSRVNRAGWIGWRSLAQSAQHSPRTCTCKEHIATRKACHRPAPGAMAPKEMLGPARVVQPPTQSRCLPPATVRLDCCRADRKALLRRPTGAGRSKAKAAPQDARWQVHVRTVLHQRLNDFEIRLGCRRRQRRISRAANDVDGVGSCTEQQLDHAKVPADGSVPDNGSQAET